MLCQVYAIWTVCTCLRCFLQLHMLGAALHPDPYPRQLSRVQSVARPMRMLITEHIWLHNGTWRSMP